MITRLSTELINKIIDKAYLDPKISPIIQRLLNTLAEKEILSEQDIKNIVGY